MDARRVKKGDVLSFFTTAQESRAAYCLALSQGEVSACMPGLICTVCSTLFFDYVPGSSVAEAISYFLLPFPEQGV